MPRAPLTIQRMRDGKGAFVSVNCFGKQFRIEFISFRNDYFLTKGRHHGWYKALTEEWPNWIARKLTDLIVIPSVDCFRSLFPCSDNKVKPLPKTCHAAGLASGVTVGDVPEVNERNPISNIKYLETIASQQERIKRLCESANISAFPKKIAPLEITHHIPGRQVDRNTEAEVRTIEALLTSRSIVSAKQIGEGGFGTVFALGPGDKLVIKVGKQSLSLADVVDGSAGTEALALHIAKEQEEAIAGLPVDSFPFVSFAAMTKSDMFGESGLVAVKDPVSALWSSMVLMKAAKKNAADHVRFLSNQFKEKNGDLRSDALDLIKQFLRAVLLAIFWMHFARIANKDIKPENLLVSEREADSKSVFMGEGGIEQVIYIGDYGHAALPGIASTAKKGSLQPQTTFLSVSPILQRTLGTQRAAKIAKQNALAAAPELIPKNPPKTNMKVQVVTIEELREQHCGLKCRPNVATREFCPPERESQASGGFHVSEHFFPGDLYAVGIIAAKILSGGCLPSTSKNDTKLRMAAATDEVFWSEFLCKNRRASIPDCWKPAINLARSLLDADPVTRLTCKEALEHPFFSSGP